MFAGQLISWMDAQTPPETVAESALVLGIEWMRNAAHTSVDEIVSELCTDPATAAQFEPRRQQLTEFLAKFLNRCREITQRFPDRNIPIA